MRLDDVCPGSTVCDVPHCVHGYMELFADGFQGASSGTGCTNRANVGLGEQGGWILFAGQAVLSSATFRDHVAHVVGVGAEKQMVRANTQLHVAVVTDKEAVGDGTVRQFPRNVVRVDHVIPTLRPMQAAIAVARGAGPQPTGFSLIDLQPEAFWLEGYGRSHDRHIVKHEASHG